MHYSVINPNIRDIIRQSTNKYIESKTCSSKCFSNSDIPNSNFLLLPLVSLLSFLAGYNFHKLTSGY